MTVKSPWEVLSRIDVTDKIEKKNGLSYLSWAWAWGVLKEHYPQAWFRKHEGANGYPYFMDVQGYAFVRVTVGLDRSGDYEVTESLPVLDHRNKPIQGPNAFEVNNALQRCLTKAVAYLGLGHYIYAGEDLPVEGAGSPAEAPSKPGAPTPAGTNSAPVAPQTAAAPGVPVMGLEGDVASHPADTVAQVFLSFIPTCNDEKSLSRFYTQNKTAIAFLQEKQPDTHKSVLEAFSARKAALKSAAA